MFQPLQGISPGRLEVCLAHLIASSTACSSQLICRTYALRCIAPRQHKADTRPHATRQAHNARLRRYAKIASACSMACSKVEPRPSANAAACSASLNA